MKPLSPPSSELQNSPSDDRLHEAIRAVVHDLIEPKLLWKIGELNLIRAVELDDRELRVSIALVCDDPTAAEDFRREAEQVLEPLLDNRRLVLELGNVKVAMQGVEGVERVVLVGSGKGGVGKSTVATHLALGLAARGHRVGLMDADIYGPSIPTMLGTNERPTVLANDYLLPVEAHGIKAMSVGFLVAPDATIDWRGAMASGTVLQFVRQTFWGALDYLIVDLPPGTGDIQLSLAHLLKCDGVVLVTTPQEVALGDVRRSLGLFRDSRIPLLGVVENMSFFDCEHCGEANLPFPASARGLFADLAPEETPATLARIPLLREVCAAGDAGTPLIAASEASASGRAFQQLAQAVASRLPTAAQTRESSAASPGRPAAAASSPPTG
jgi:ATP-binding protein involved in chromosome partitioning